MMRGRRLIGPSFPFHSVPIEASAPGEPATSWDPATKHADIALSDYLSSENIDASNSTNDLIYASVFSTTGKTSSDGKLYIEMKVIVSANDGLKHLGLSTLDKVNFGLENTIGCDAGEGGGFITYNNTVAAWTGIIDVEEVLCLPIDFAAGKMFAGKNGGFGGQNPEAGTSPVFTWTPTATALYACCELYGFGNLQTIRILTGANQEYTPPVGYARWT